MIFQKAGVLGGHKAPQAYKILGELYPQVGVVHPWAFDLRLQFHDA